ncbi:hypothetical protein LB503_001885 [Fusarium chuoi]|nr:hypothetical protein LB503_001885 [Fusarium chuoi]
MSSGSTCVEASKWHSQCIPDVKASPSSKAAVGKFDVDFPSFEFRRLLEAPGSGSGNQNGDGND